MIIYPAIDLRGGRCVRLSQGRFDRETVYADDPLEMARGFAAAGAAWLHLVDLDGARDGAAQQGELIRRIAGQAALKVQTGGGLRSEQQIRDHLEDGIERVVIGSLALTNPGLTRSWLERFGGERIVLALDVAPAKDGRWQVATQGWQQDSGRSLFEVADDYAGAGLSHVLCTDVARDGLLAGANVELYRALKERYPGLAIQASGGVAGLEDVRALRAAGIDGVVIGKALYEGRFTLAEALAC
jgi:phosphoribosylformimino-5-aminoimidazole carboxamide ribotide isomerase